MSGDFSPLERAMLDRLTVPPARGALAADIVSKAIADNDRPVPPRRSGRGIWRGRGVVLASAGALLLASASAATTGLFDKLPAAIPAIASVIGVILPRPKAEKKAKPVHLVRREPARPTPGASVPVPDPTPEVQTLADRAAELRARRIETGLPVMAPGERVAVKRRLAARFAKLPPERRAKLREKFASMTPEQRANTYERIRERVVENRNKRRALRAQNTQAGMPAPVDSAPPPELAGPGARPGVDRATILERRRERRRLRFERRWRMMDDAN